MHDAVENLVTAFVLFVTASAVWFALTSVMATIAHYARKSR
jgi:hypothetical protein